MEKLDKLISSSSTSSSSSASASTSVSSSSFPLHIHRPPFSSSSSASAARSPPSSDLLPPCEQPPVVLWPDALTSRPQKHDRNDNDFDRKVSRSRSVGCGSRSFSGDFFERISTGFGDYTFRRVSSHREPNGHGNTRHRISSANPDYCMKNRVQCGRIFGGFVLASPSSSYWIMTSFSEGHHFQGVNRAQSTAPEVDATHGKSESWGGWVFASPMLRRFQVDK